MKDLSDCLAVLQAGGKGTRMLPLTGDKVPKPLLRLGGRPMLEWQIVNLHKYGIREFVIIVGHLGDQIERYFNDGTRLGVHIRYIVEKEPLGSGGALVYLKEMLQDIRHILIALGDVMFDIDVCRFVAFHEKRGGVATLLVHPNGHPQDSDLVKISPVDSDPADPVIESIGGCVVGFDSKTNQRNYYYDNCVNAGLYLLEPKIIQKLTKIEPLDLEKNILIPYIKQQKLFAYRTTEYVKDAGTPERFQTVEKELFGGNWAARNLEMTQRCIFFDRDGTLNVYRGLISRVEDLELLTGAAEAVKAVNRSKYLAMVVSNQPVVARGLIDISGVREIHRRLQVLLGKEEAYLDDIAFCPHHPDKGYSEENPVYKITCTCRKPGTGMIEALSKRWHVDVTSSWFIGDSQRDILCGKRAGLRTVLVETGEYQGGKLNPQPDMVASNVLEAVRRILEVEL